MIYEFNLNLIITEDITQHKDIAGQKTIRPMPTPITHVAILSLSPYRDDPTCIVMGRNKD